MSRTLGRGRTALVLWQRVHNGRQGSEIHPCGREDLGERFGGGPSRPAIPANTLGAIEGCWVQTSALCQSRDRYPLSLCNGVDGSPDLRVSDHSAIRAKEQKETLLGAGAGFLGQGRICVTRYGLMCGKEAPVIKE